MSRALLVILLSTLPAAAQDGKKPDPKKVDQAITRGVAFLRTAERTGYPDRKIAHCDELVLWTFVHAGVPDTDAMFQELLKTLLEAKLDKTYSVSLQAMILEELDRAKYQGRIAQCAQFLLDNQCASGQWSYGEATPFSNDVPTGTPVRKEVSTSGKAREFDPVPASGPRGKPPVVNRITLKKMREGPGEGDNSNSQYAALGLRACHDAGIVLPRESIQLAQKWWRESQHEEKASDKNAKPKVATGAGAAAGEPAGWCYGPKGHGHAAYGSMTAGAVGALTIYSYILGEKWKVDAPILMGLGWMAKNFTVTDNPGPPEWGEGKPGYMVYYYLYAMERAAILFGAEVIGGHRWYLEGAEEILRAQKPDGSWNAGAPEANSAWETCFAVLFLKRATRPLDVASSDRFHPQK